MKVKYILFILIITILFFPKSASADGIVIPDPPICDPSPCSPLPVPTSQLEIKYHHVDVQIESQVAVTQVDQVFYNPNNWIIEGVYVFPIPHGAVVSNFTLWIDGEPIEGKVMDSEEARSIYEEIVREMRDPALLEYIDQDAVQVRIFPIPPGGERRIELEYSEILQVDSGLVKYLYPLNTEKFSTRPLDTVHVNINIKSHDPIRAAYSPSHPVEVDKDGNFRLTAGYEASNVKPDTDFVFYYSIGDTEAFHLISYRDPEGENRSDGFFTLLLAPKSEAISEPIPKDVMIVLDKSGSMEGEKFVQAQNALVYILNNLNQDDRFNLVAFSTSVDIFSSKMNDSLKIDEAISWVNRLSALGSTDINRALLEAVSLSNIERPTYLIFLTDGLPTEGVVESDEITRIFESHAPDNIRLFAFGVGYDVDTYLLDTLAQNHHGTSSYVEPGEKLDEILSSFYAKISSPVLTNLKLIVEGTDVYDIYPTPLPDLFQGSQITVVGRYRNGGSVRISLKGMVNNLPQSFVYPDQFLAINSRDQSNGEEYLQFIPRLWATRKIGFLLNEVRLQGPELELIDQIVKLSIRYGIVTPYTSYLVTEPMPLGAAEQNRIAEEQFLDMESGLESPTYGREAVEKSAAQGEMEHSDSIAAAIPDVENQVRVVGSRTFVLSDDIWIDTAYDPDIMNTIKVSFLSEEYFYLTGTDNVLAASFALGSRVIALTDGIVYEIVSSDTPSDPIEMKSNRDNKKTEDYLDSLISETGKSGENPQTDSNKNENVDTSEKKLIDNKVEDQTSCLGGLLPLIFASAGIVVISKKRT